MKKDKIHPLNKIKRKLKRILTIKALVSIPGSRVYVIYEDIQQKGISAMLAKPKIILIYSQFSNVINSITRKNGGTDNYKYPFGKTHHSFTA